jgi:hypothetical protein
MSIGISSYEEWMLSVRQGDRSPYLGSVPGVARRVVLNANKPLAIDANGLLCLIEVTARHLCWALILAVTPQYHPP